MKYELKYASDFAITAKIFKILMSHEKKLVSESLVSGKEGITQIIKLKTSDPALLQKTEARLRKIKTLEMSILKEDAD